MSRAWTAAVVLLCLAGVAMTGGRPAAAETPAAGRIVITLPADLTADERAALIGALNQLPRPLVVAKEDAAASAADTAPADTGSAITGAMDRLDEALEASGALPGVLAAWWSNLSRAGSGFGPIWVVAAIIAAIFGGLASERGVDWLLKTWRQRCIDASPQRFSTRMGFAVGWMALEVIGIAAFAAAALLIGWLLLPSNPPARLTLAVVVVATFKARLVLTVTRLVFAPKQPGLRLAPMPDADAETVWRWILLATIVNAVAFSARDLMMSAGADRAVVTLLGLGALSMAAAARLIAIYRVRRPIRDLIVREYAPAAETPSNATLLIAGVWHVAFFLLVLLDFTGSAYEELTAAEAGYASLSFGSFFIIALLPFAIGGYGALVDDLARGPDSESRRVVLAGALKAFGQGVIALGAITILATKWGADPFAAGDAGWVSRIVHSGLQIGAALLLGWTAWQAIKLALDACAATTSQDAGSEDGMGKPGSRLETVLPILRVFLFVAIVTICSLTALSAFGVNIGPLLAGAGVLGLAVGFGAQTLVKDIITGLFYLAEDAFRKGEYIQCSGGKGVVERFSIRSIQLRHHNGPLHTIPFGSMGNITNHSRDWVRVKFQIRVPFDTDLDRVRKVIKRVGEEMAADPELGPRFLEPIKSQGAVDTDESGFLTSVKFVCRPGEQFVVRREAFARIQKAFEENGIEFASRRVTIDSGQDVSPAVQAAATAAAGR